MNTTEQIAEQICSQLDVVELAKEVGIEIRKNGQYYQSKSFIDPGNNDTAVNYNFNGTNLWHDFKEHKTGDVIQLYAITKCKGDRKQAFKELMMRCNITPAISNYHPDTELIQDKKDFINKVNSWHQALQTEHREYLHSRGITDKTIDTLKIGYNIHQNRIMIPYYLEEDKDYSSPVYACGRIFNDKNLNKESNKNAPPKYTKISLSKGETIDQKTGKRIPIKNKYLKNIVWGQDTLSRKKGNILIICEGAFDALSIWQEGYAVISPLTTAFNKEQKEALPEILSRFHEVVIILDNDEAGRKNTYNLAKICYDNQIEFSISSVKEKETFITKTDEKVEIGGMKDVSDYYATALIQRDLFAEINKKEKINTSKETINKNRREYEILKPLIDRRQNGLVYLCQKKANFYYYNYGKRYDEIEKIINVACRFYPDRYVRLPIEYFRNQLKIYTSTKKEKNNSEKKISELKDRKEKEKKKEELAKIEVQILSEIEKLKETKNRLSRLNEKIIKEEDLRDLETLIKKGPKSSVLIEEILSNHILLFDPANGFFEFNGLCWENKPDQYIQHIISEHLGKFHGGRKSTDIQKALEGTCHKSVDFNTKEILAFKNCVLNLQTGLIAKEGNPDDYITYQLDFNYDSEANCPRWIQFLDEISDSNDKRMQLLKETGGYVLFSNSNLHKCIYLVGSGSNGKSLFLNMIENVFGAKNTTHVPLAELDNEFKRISFRTSLMNISPDDTGSLPKSCLGIFKNIVAEDPIDGAKKHKDSINFRPRVKLMVASEHLPKTHDIGYGMDRRFLFIEFPTRFVRHPKLSGEKQLDPNLEEKLKKELPGIFNFFYQGYQELKQNNAFSESSEELKLHEEFKVKNNIVLEFLHDVDLTTSDSISNKDAYAEFAKWCSGVYGEVPITQKSFSRTFRKEFINLHPEYMEFNTSGYRGVKKKEPEQLHMFK